MEILSQEKSMWVSSKNWATRRVDDCRNKTEKREEKKEAMLALPAICGDDSVHPLGGVVDAELSGLFLGPWSADVACPSDRLVFSWMCAAGTISNASIIESSHNRVEAIVW